MIWCTNDPNVHIRIFRRRWRLNLKCFFPMSILNEYLIEYVADWKKEQESDINQWNNDHCHVSPKFPNLLGHLQKIVHRQYEKEYFSITYEFLLLYKLHLTHKDKSRVIVKRLKNLIKNFMKLTGMKSKVANIHLNLMKYF